MASRRKVRLPLLVHHDIRLHVTLIVVEGASSSRAAITEVVRLINLQRRQLRLAHAVSHHGCQRLLH